MKEKHLQFNHHYILCLLVCQMKCLPMGIPLHKGRQRNKRLSHSV